MVNMGGNISKEINKFFTKDIKKFFEQIPDAFKEVGKEITGTFKDFGNTLKEGFEDIGQEISEPFIEIGADFKKFGLEVKGGFGVIKESFEGVGMVFDEIGETIDVSFGYVVETGKFIGDLTMGTLEFVFDILKQIIKLFPAVIRILKVFEQLLEKGFDILPIFVLILPALCVFYYAVIIIEILDKKDG